MLFILIAVIAAYLVGVYIVTKYSMEKLGARSPLFGNGLVNIVIGFSVSAVASEVGLAVGYDYWNEAPSVLYYLARFGFLILGISGIVMVAIDLLRVLVDLDDHVARAEDKIRKSENTPSEQPKSIPTWKRIQKDNE